MTCRLNGFIDAITETAHSPLQQLAQEAPLLCVSIPGLRSIIDEVC